MYYSYDDIAARFHQVIHCSDNDQAPLRNLEVLHTGHGNYLLLLLQQKHATQDVNGNWSIFNQQPASDGLSRLCGELYYYNVNNNSLTSTLFVIPVLFGTPEISFHYPYFHFIAEDESLFIHATQTQIKYGSRHLLPEQGVSEQDIAATFINIMRYHPEPVKISDYGELICTEKSCDYFSGVINHQGFSVPLSLSVDEPDDVIPLLPKLELMLSKLAQLEEQARQYAAQQLTEIWNEYWVAEDEPALSTEQFAAQLTLQEMMMETDGILQLSFWNPTRDEISVGYSLDQQFISAELG